MSATRPREPRYLQLKALLQSRIEDGTYPVDTLMPTEADLCAEFGVSRHTVREALRMLIGAGLVTRRQGSGTQVAARHTPGNYVHQMRSLSELFQYAADTVFHISSIATRKPESGLAAQLGEEAANDWLQLVGVRLDHEGATPICHATVHIHRDFAAVARSLDHNEGAIYRLIEQQFGVTVADVVQEISSAPMSRQAATALGASSKTWAVRVTRRYMSSDGQLLILSVNDHPGDRFSYTMHLRRERVRS